EILPVGAEQLERCHPVYEELPGWTASTVGIKTHDRLPAAARAYLKRIEELAGVPVDLISTGPDREETIVRRHPYDAYKNSRSDPELVRRLGDQREQTV